MGMNPETNRFEPLAEQLRELVEKKADDAEKKFEALHPLIRPDGSPVPKHWSVFRVDELVVIKNYTFRVKYIGETAILFEPAGPVIAGPPCEEGGL
jgi:hypothetical protein